MKKNNPSRQRGAPKGNQNARKRDPRPILHVRVDVTTMAKLQQWADAETGGNIGRFIDKFVGAYCE